MQCEAELGLEDSCIQSKENIDSLPALFSEQQAKELRRKARPGCQWLSLVVLPLMTIKYGLNAYSTVAPMVQQSTVGFLKGSFSKDAEKDGHSPSLGMRFRLRRFYYDVEQYLRKRRTVSTLLDHALQIAELL